MRCKRRSSRSPDAMILSRPTIRSARSRFTEVMALAIAYGHARAPDFFTDEPIREPVLQAWRKATTTAENEALARPVAIATLRLVDGREISAYVDLRHRTATGRDKWAVVEAKLTDLTADLLPANSREVFASSTRPWTRPSCSPSWRADRARAARLRGTDYRVAHRGFLFSRNAATPSRASWAVELRAVSSLAYS